jgi:chaperone required for assembly of F1-ATPase
MRELFEDYAGRSPLDPNEAARATMRVPLRRKFYEHAGVAETARGFAVELDGRTLRTPARRLFALPRRAVAEGAAAEWRAQGDHINPATMPLTRLINSIIDGVADRSAEVADDIVRYAASDLILYRAEHPRELVARQAAFWDPVLEWARVRLGADLVAATGVMRIDQPEAALAAVRMALPAGIWRLGALHAATTLTGSALLALALMHGQCDAARCWQAAHVDEDWNFGQWGADPAVLDRRAGRFRELEAAQLVLAPDK